MAFIDDKGKLFGKINIIDLMVVLFIILVIAVGTRFAFLAPEETKVTIDVLFKNTPPWMADQISQGDTEVSDDRIIAKIINIDAAPAVMIIPSDSGKVYKGEHPDLKDMTATFEVIANRQQDTLFFHNDKLKIGQEFSFEAAQYEITGIITSIS